MQHFSLSRAPTCYQNRMYFANVERIVQLGTVLGRELLTQGALAAPRAVKT